MLYKDDTVLVCIKPPGVLSEEDGMPRLLRAQCGVRDVYCVHRLDGQVGGLMVYALTGKSAAALSGAMAAGSIRKEYLAVVQGCPADDGATLRDLIYRDAAKNKSYVVSRMRRGVREAELEYRVLERGAGISLVLVRLHTGRSHQIRLQFASRSMPLLGDVRYGSRYKDCALALWSCALSFPHPATGDSMSFSAAPDPRWPWDSFEYLKEGK